MTGDDFISLAGKLAADHRNGESGYRSAVSRAYYGAFHVACSLLKELGILVPENASGHQFVFLRLSRAGESETEDAARKLDSLRGERNDADYKLANQKFRAQKNAQLAVERALQIAEQFNRCRDEPLRSNIRTQVEAADARLRPLGKWGLAAQQLTRGRPGATSSNGPVKASMERRSAV